MDDSKDRDGGSGLTSQLPLNRLKDEAVNLAQAVTGRGVAKVGDRIDSLTGRLNDIASGKSTGEKVVKNVAGGDSTAKAGVKAVAGKVTDSVKEAAQKLTRAGGGGGQKIKVTNIVEQIDVPVPRHVAYAQWTQFEDFPTFTKKVENVEQQEDQKLVWKAQIFWSHRSWTATIVDQVPDERIVWKSEGEKGHVDGAVTFHELAPNLTRVLVLLEYHPKGLFEHVGNIWRAQGRRARLELKHFARHVSTQTLLHQDDIDGWSGEIHDDHVVQSSDSSGSEQQGDSRKDRSADRSGGADKRSREGGAGDKAPRESADEEPSKSAARSSEGKQGGGSEGRPDGPRRPKAQASGDREDRPRRRQRTPDGDKRSEQATSQG